MPAYIPPLLGLVGLLIALGIFRVVLSYPEGNPEVKKIGDMIHSGAMSFMKTEYMYLVVFVLILAFLVFFALGWDCLLYTSPSPRDNLPSRMPSSA